MPTTPIPRIAVKSSNVRSIGYDASQQALDVEFGSGGVYRYAGVPPETHAKLMAAESVGRFVGSEIKGKFVATRLDQKTAA